MSGSTLLLEVVRSGATREMAYCGNHITDFRGPRGDGRVGRVVEEASEQACRTCRVRAMEKTRREHNMGLALGSAGVVAFGKNEDEAGEYGSAWWEFGDPIEADDALDRLRNAGVRVEGWTCHSGDWDCCGRTFSHGAVVRVSNSRTLVHQSWSRDN